MIPFIKIRHTDDTGTVRDITNFVNFNQKRGLQMKTTTCDFTLRIDSPVAANVLFNPDGSLIFSEMDTVEVWLKSDEVINTATDTPLITGNIQKMSTGYEEKSRVLRIGITDKTVLLLSRMFPTFSVSGTQDQADELIRFVVKHISDSGNQQYSITTNNVASTKSDGNAFKTITYGTDWKPAYDTIAELSQPEFTGDDRAYIFYVDANNDLHWFYPSQSNPIALTEGTDKILKMNLEYSTRDMVNMVIFKCGTDKSGNAIYDYYFDPSIDSSELRMQYQNWQSITEDMQSATDPFDWAGSNDDQIRTEAKKRGKAKAQVICQAFGNPRWKGTIQMKGNTSFTAGDLLSLTSTSYGLKAEKVRVHDVIHNIDKNGWTTTLEIDQDAKAITS